jgi:predicted DNA-binding transcriptional regulator AlpA
MSARLLSPASVAALLDRKVQTLAVWRTQGRGPQFVKLGGGAGARVAYREADVQAWVKALPTFANTLERKAGPGRVAAPCGPAVVGSPS